MKTRLRAGFFMCGAGKIVAMRPVEIGLFIGLAVLILVTVFLLLRIHALRREQQGLPALLTQDMEARHRAVLTDLHAGLSQQSDRMQGQLATLQIAQTERLAETRATVTGQFGQFQTAMLEKLIEQGRAERGMLQDTLKGMTAHFNERVQQLSQRSMAAERNLRQSPSGSTKDSRKPTKPSRR
jgi:DNA recombination protein RmuC